MWSTCPDQRKELTAFLCPSVRAIILEPLVVNISAMLLTSCSVHVLLVHLRKRNTRGVFGGSWLYETLPPPPLSLCAPIIRREIFFFHIAGKRSIQEREPQSFERKINARKQCRGSWALALGDQIFLLTFTPLHLRQKIIPGFVPVSHHNHVVGEYVASRSSLTNEFMNLWETKAQY